MRDTLVIIPTFNEKENIEKIIRTTFSQVKEFDILVVDDNSPDGTGDIVNGQVQIALGIVLSSLFSVWCPFHSHCCCLRQTCGNVY